MPEFKKWHERDITREIKCNALQNKYPWRIRIDAMCQDFRKVILFYRIPRNKNALYAMLIHEICHVNTKGHGKKWVEKMNRAYCSALNISNGLAKCIRLHLIKEDLAEKIRTGKIHSDN
jgi:hypothetical protein